MQAIRKETGTPHVQPGSCRCASWLLAAISMPCSAPISLAVLRERRRARVDFAAGGNVMNRGFGSVVAVLLALHAAPAQAQEAWPSRPVKFIVPSSPGGGTDLYARELGQALSDSLKQQFIVDNRPGASGNIG